MDENEVFATLGKEVIEAFCKYGYTVLTIDSPKPNSGQEFWLIRAKRREND